MYPGNSFLGATYPGGAVRAPAGGGGGPVPITSYAYTPKLTLYPSESLAPTASVPATGVKMWNGSAFVVAKFWNGTAWVTGKVWNGTTWVP